MASTPPSSRAICIPCRERRGKIPREFTLTSGSINLGHKSLGITGAACIGLAILFLAPCAAAQIPLQQSVPNAPQTIAVNVQRVSVGAIVTDAKGKFVEGLRREYFHVFDNGEEQVIADFSPVDEPGQVLLLVETGPAVYLLRDAHVFAADALMNGLSAGDRIAIAGYSDLPVGILSFTTDKGAAMDALHGLQFNLGMAQLNLLQSLNTVLDWLEKVPGKKTIVLLSTGVDTSQSAVVQTLQLRLQTGEVRILCLSLSGPVRNGKLGNKQRVQEMQQAFESADALLRALAENTGGRAYFPKNAKEFQQVYAQIAQLVRHEYSLTFVPPAADGAVHPLQVKVDLPTLSESGKPPEYHVDHRKAYIAPKPAEAKP
jgi:VWFA-related protein